MEPNHWHEGLFLQPQHFQHQQQHWEQAMRRERNWRFPDPYGLIRREVDTEALGNWRLTFHHIEAILPSGRYLHWPGNAEVPSVDLKPLFGPEVETLDLLLGVPVWYPQRRNIVPEGEPPEAHRILYRTEIREVYDENVGDNPKEIPVRRLNAMLLPADANLDNLETLPLLRLRRSLNEETAVPKIDPEFIPPCLVCGGSPIVVELLQQLSATVERRRESLALRLQRSGFRIPDFEPSQLESVLRLQVLNRLRAVAPQWYRSSHSLALSELHSLLQASIGELLALYPERQEEFPFLPYLHDHPGENLYRLFRRLFDLLEGDVISNFLRLPFRKTDYGWLAELEDEHLHRPVEYFLGLQTSEALADLPGLVEDRDRFKLMARDQSDRAVFGIVLEHQATPPNQLPARARLHYFRLRRDRSQRMWQEVEETRQLIARWPHWETSEMEPALYMVLPA
jgi:type VI secretion system protein ImpJ